MEFGGKMCGKCEIKGTFGGTFLDDFSKKGFLNTDKNLRNLKKALINIF